MLEAPRWGDAAWWARPWDDARPRLLWLRLDADRVRIRWGMPVWALEEPCSSSDLGSCGSPVTYRRRCGAA